MARKKNLPSSVDKLPPQVRDEVNRARQQFGWTIDQLVEYCSEEGHHVSRSAMGRHVKSLHLEVEEAAEKINRAQSIGTALVERFGDKQDNELARLNIQMLQSQVLEVLLMEQADEDGNPTPRDPMSIMRLSKSVQQLLSAEKMNAERISQIRKEAREQAKQEAAEAVETVAKRTQGGLTKDTIDAIKREILKAG